MKLKQAEGLTARRVDPAAIRVSGGWFGALVLTLIAAPALAGVQGIRVQVDGLACPFCAYNIEKRFKTLDGVDHKADFEVNTEAGYARFAWVPTVAFDPAVVDEQVRRAGFTPAGIELTAEGSVSWVPPQDQTPGRLILLSPSTGQRVSLLSDERADRAASFDALQALAQHSDKEQPGIAARVRGAVVASEDGAWRLALYGWEPMTYGALVELDVDGMTREGSLVVLIKALSDEPGVIHVRTDQAAGRVRVWTERDTPDADAFRRKIEEAGFKVTGSRSVEPQQQAEQETNDDR